MNQWIELLPQDARRLEIHLRKAQHDVVLADTEVGLWGERVVLIIHNVVPRHPHPAEDRRLALEYLAEKLRNPGHGATPLLCDRAEWSSDHIEYFVRRELLEARHRPMVQQPR